jgi:Fe-S-cluster-containing dehydrogenase component/DMSO reductase anchor subunit
VSAGQGFALDLNRCTGCRACELACCTENDLGWGRSWRRIETFNPERDPRLPHHHLSVACNHCEAAPCRTACPARAITRDELDGRITLHDDRCMGCRYCSWACPFEAPLFDEDTRTMGKCTLCPQRTETGLQPACVEACPTEALTLAPLDDAGRMTDVAGFPVTDALPAIRFAPQRRGAEPPETTWTLDQDVLDAFDAARKPHPTAGDLSHEWPLLVFTLAAAVLVAAQTALVAGTDVPRWTLLAAAVVAMGVSTLHLGRPERGWRAVLGVGSSWLSREIVLYGVFVGGLAMQAVWPGMPAIAWGAATGGWLALIAVDRVYDPVRRPRHLPVHSADVLGAAALLAAVATEQALPALLIGGVRGVLVALRVSGASAEGRAWLALRVGLLVGGLISALAGHETTALWLIIAGEVLDRTLFYRDLRPVTLRETCDRDAAWRLANHQRAVSCISYTK